MFDPLPYKTIRFIDIVILLILIFHCLHPYEKYKVTLQYLFTTKKHSGVNIPACLTNIYQ